MEEEEEEAGGIYETRFVLSEQTTTATTNDLRYIVFEIKKLQILVYYFL